MLVTFCIQGTDMEDDSGFLPIPPLNGSLQDSSGVRESDVSLDLATPVKIPITSQPIKRRSEPSEEDNERIVKRTLICTERDMEGRGREVNDRYSLFGQYIACELREISDPDMERWAKQQIVTILCQAQSRSLPAN